MAFVDFGEIVAVFKTGHIGDIRHDVTSFVQQFARFAHPYIVQVFKQ